MTESLRRRMEWLGIREEDLEERFIRSAGPGGQNVNKVATCVCLRHRPSGLEVKVQRERSQAQNRLLARRLLCEKLEEARRARLEEQRRRLYQARRAKRRRSRRAKEKMLASKRIHSIKKQMRARPGVDE